jgi:hypothetical protein
MKHIKRTFGVDLTTLVKAQSTLVPAAVVICIEGIESRGVDSQGLYRVCGFHGDIEAVKMSFDKDAEKTRACVEQCKDVNTLASVLKMFFRLLPIPLITFDVYFKLIDIVAGKVAMPTDKQLEAIRTCLTQLPAAHFHTLKYLMAHLHRVSERRAVNLMSAENLSIVFTPNLLRCPDIESSSISCSGLSALKNERALVDSFASTCSELKNERAVVELLIRHCEILFP